jgi:hypothetical protein
MRAADPLLPARGGVYPGVNLSGSEIVVRVTQCRQLCKPRHLPHGKGVGSDREVGGGMGWRICVGGLGGDFGPNPCWGSRSCDCVKYLEVPRRWGKGMTCHDVGSLFHYILGVCMI